jgi:hypothetical protein
MSQSRAKVAVSKGVAMGSEVEMSISCADCVRRGTPDCQDCLVTHVLGGTPDELVMTSDDVDVVQLFTAQGMLPRLRFHHRAAQS